MHAPAAHRGRALPRHILAVGSLLAYLCLSSPASAKQPLVSGQISPALAAKLEQAGDLTLTDTTLPQALFTISKIWSINVVVGEEVQGGVNGVFKNAPLQEILHSLLYANGYGYRVVGESLVVVPLKNLGDTNPMFESTTISLQTAEIADVVAAANLLKSPQGKVQAIGSARTILVVDLPERLRVIRQLCAELDAAAAAVSAGGALPAARLEVIDFNPQFVDAASLLEAIQTILSERGKAAVVAAENRLVVMDDAVHLRLAAQVVARLDQPAAQVRITALIYDISLEDIERFGVNWSHAGKARIAADGSAQSFFSLDSLLASGVAAGDPSGAMTFASLSRHLDVRATIDALCQQKDSRLLADPTVTVENRKPATMQIVTEIPYSQLTQTGSGPGIGTTAFREAGVTLTVTPHIAEDGTIKLTVTPTFSRLAGFTSGSDPQPIIDKRQAETTVRVANQQTFVLGGLRQRSDVNDNRGIPFLKDIKAFHLGKLFQTQETTVKESELLVFITPEIITPVHLGRDRERAAEEVGNSVLHRIPVAHDGCDKCAGCCGCANKKQPFYVTSNYFEEGVELHQPVEENTPPPVVVEEQARRPAYQQKDVAGSPLRRQFRRPGSTAETEMPAPPSTHQTPVQVAARPQPVLRRLPSTGEANAPARDSAHPAASEAPIRQASQPFYRGLLPR